MNLELRKLINVGWLASIAVAASMGNARAVAISSWSFHSEHVSLDGGIKMGEFTNSDPSKVGYSFDILGAGLMVETFLISFQVQSGVSYNYTAPGGWTGQFVGKSSWNAPSYGSPTFESWFGTQDNMVLILSNSGGMGESNDADSTQWNPTGSSFTPQFTRTGMESTEFVALGGSNVILGGSVIPEPGTALLAAFGGLALLRRKR